jgi:hypothetical protein
MAAGAILGLLDSIIGSGSNSGAKGDKQAGGLGYNILGAPGDPGGTAYDLWNAQRKRKDEMNRQAVEDAFRQKALDLTQRGMMNEQTNATRGAGMNSLQYLASQRANAEILGRNRSIRNSILYQ